MLGEEPAIEASSLSLRGKLLVGIIFFSIIIPTVGGYHLVRETRNTLKDVIITKSIAFRTKLAKQIKPALEFDDNETAKEISDAITLNSFIRVVRFWKFDVFDPERKPSLFTEVLIPIRSKVSNVRHQLEIPERKRSRLIQI